MERESSVLNDISCHMIETGPILRKECILYLELESMLAMVYKSFKATGTAGSEQVVGRVCSTSNSDCLHRAHIYNVL